MRIGVIVEGANKLGMQFEGIWRVCLRLTAALCARGDEVIFFCQRQNTEELDENLRKFVEWGRYRIVNISDGRLPFDEVQDPHDSESGKIMADLVKLAKIPVDVWFNPNPMWSAVQRMSGPKVCVLHDFLIGDYPACYKEFDYRPVLETFRRAGKIHDQVICSSSYVRDQHATKLCHIPREKISIVHTPPIVDRRDQGNNDILVDRSRLRTLLQRSLPNWMQGRERELFLHHTVNLPFGELPYIFLSTQNRPHKNMRLAAEALQILIRRKYEGIIGLTTALIEIRGQSEFEKYLLKEKLNGSFLSLGKLSDEAHFLAYRFAVATVHTSPFEGNFPLPFAESVSCGTPCLVAYSPAYDEFICGSEREHVFFKPNAANLAERIAYVCSNRAEILDVQRQILGRMCNNTWDGFANSYTEVFKRAIHDSGVEPESFTYEGKL